MSEDAKDNGEKKQEWTPEAPGGFDIDKKGVFHLDLDLTKCAPQFAIGMMFSMIDVIKTFYARAAQAAVKKSPRIYMPGAGRH